MMPKTSVATAEHYTWGDPRNACDGWYLLRSPGLTVIEERMPPGAFEKRHLHRRSRQLFYVLSGELTLEVAGELCTLGPGEALEIEPGTAHQAINHSSSNVRFLVTSQPPSHGDREAAYSD